MKYSVVIPLYNKQNYIEKTLRSVLNQTYQDYEIIVVNDGSTDHSLEKVHNVYSKKIKIIEQKNQGVAAARNTGIKHAKGEYIAFLDADDTWMESYLETINDLVHSYETSDIFVTAYKVNLKNEKYKISTQLIPEKGCLDSYWTTLQKGYDFVWTSVTTIRKSAIIAAGGFKEGEKIGQDLDMWARVARINPKVAYSAKVCAEYNRFAESNARTREKIAWAAAFLKDLEEEMENPCRSAEEYEAIQRKYDMKMTVYVFTCILSGEKKRAAEELKRWKGKRNFRNTTLRTGLKIAGIVPNWINRILYAIRIKIF